MASTERTPLVPKPTGSEGNGSITKITSNISSSSSRSSNRSSSWVNRLFSVENRILFAGFLITLSFSFTQVPLFYVFRLMECDVFYDNHPPYEGAGERCSRNEIAAGTAAQISILGMSTTICGTFNLFLTGWLVKKRGPRLAIVVQTLVPAARVAAQSLGVAAGRRAGMLIIQCTQLVTVLGGPAGYILVVNIIAGEVVEPARRTAVFGMLQGAIMLGQGLGYLTGGMIGDAINIRAPFDVAFASFLISVLYARFCLPYISPDSMSDSNNNNKNNNKSGSPSSSGGFLAPLRLLRPQRLRLRDGRPARHLGVLFLCAGIFVGVVATDYAPLLIQMYATAAFDFDQADNGWLMSEFAFMRSLFLIFLFPRMISLGRKFFDRSSSSSSSGQKLLSSSSSSSMTQSGDDEARPFPTDPGEFHATSGEQADQEPVVPPKVRRRHRRGGEKEGAHFDLVFLRWSLVVDGALTTVAAFATKPWHIYLAAFLLPFGSGSAPAAKGVITGMCPDSQRADALNAVTLVENIARLTTQGLFGFVFASLANVGKAYATFFCNAAIAVVGMGVLLLSHFPPDGSILVEKDAEEDDDAHPSRNGVDENGTSTD
ncbi:hypothetical protein N3K66_007502 [Trichothecium roseum]|uniref:Uncharacterized protein n=1 Tax=Trichothecium roseum TaxID=47278 RepID=A0ACC0UVG1_9HYPO|nr:hypothetical protein N3K66_007502 [Trichothecium roseum]